MEQACAEQSYVRVAGLKVKYPQGAEKQLIKAILGREVPPELPADVGALSKMCKLLLPLPMQSFTALGLPASNHCCGSGYDPRNVLVRIGTPIRDVIDFCGGMGNPAAIIAGGPMTGSLSRT